MTSVLLVALAVAAPLPPRDAPPPTGPGPSFVQITGVNGANETITSVCPVQVTKYVPVTRVIEMMGMKRPVTEYVPVVETQLHTASYALRDYAIQTADGKPLTAKEMLGRVKAGTVVLIQTGADKIEPAYLKILNSDTIVLAQRAPKKESVPDIVPPLPPKPAPPARDPLPPK